MVYRAYGFLDGAYLRNRAREANQPLVNPRVLVSNILNRPEIQSWGVPPHSSGNIVLARVIYYDGRPDDDSNLPEQALSYWEAVELLPDTELGFGSIRGGTKKKAPRQKAVDSLMAVDMLVGAFSHTYDVAVLIAGDADFVPVVNEVKRQGIMVVIAAIEGSHLSEDLLKAGDRFIAIGPGREASWFPPLYDKEQTWSAW